MKIISLDQIPSTNDFMKNYIQSNSVEDFTVALAHHQTRGRGQQGSVWESEAFKNLSCSIYRDIGLPLNESFYMSMAVCVAIKEVVSDLVPRHCIHVKWPNDILVDNKKICGILIENKLQKRTLKNWIIGIGLNINQTTFRNLPHATSLKKITGKNHIPSEIMNLIIKKVKATELQPSQENKSHIRHLYERFLYQKDKVRTYKKLLNHKLFNGIIRGVESSGRLKMEIESGENVYFDTKEIAYC